MLDENDLNVNFFCNCILQHLNFYFLLISTVSQKCFDYYFMANNRIKWILVGKILLESAETD